MVTADKISSMKAQRSCHLGVFCEKLFLKVSQKSHGDISVEISFWIKLQGLRSATVNFYEIFKNNFFYKIHPMVPSIVWKVSKLSSK